MASSRSRLRSYGVLTVLLLLAAPVISRVTHMRTLRTWDSTPGALGMSRPLTLSLERSVAYVDVLGCYPFDRLLIQAADGGYVYVHRFQIPSADTEAFVRGCEVIWDADKVVFGMPDGEMLTFPAKVITQQTGR